MSLFLEKPVGQEWLASERTARSSRDATAAEGRATAAVAPALVTRFGSRVDVRNRGAVRIRRLAGGAGIGGADEQGAASLAPAVVRLWHADCCDELTIAEARALAAQLMEAAALADGQNRR